MSNRMPTPMSEPITPEQLFGEFVAAEGSRPFVTYYDIATGERSELSARSLANWVAKTHFLLTDELGLGLGDCAYIDLPPHWISPAAILGAFSAGLTLVKDPDIAQVAFTTPATAPLGVPDVYVIRPEAAAVGFGDDVPAGTTDFVAAVRPQQDEWAWVQHPAGPNDRGIDDQLSRWAVLDEARGLPGYARFLSIRDWHTWQDIITTLFGPLVAFGSVVYVRNTMDVAVLERICEQERVGMRLENYPPPGQ